MNAAVGSPLCHRASETTDVLQNALRDKKVRNQVIRELDWIKGHVELVFDFLDHHLDGKKHAGVIKTD